MKLTTPAFDALRPKQTFGPSDWAGGGGIDQGGTVGDPNMPGAGDSITNAIADYLQEMTAADQRAWREMNIWADIAIRRRMDNIRDQDWVVGPKNKKLPVDAALVEEITQRLDAPNPQLENNTFGGLWGAAFDDTYTIGRGVVQILPSKLRTPLAFRALDAARLRQNPDWHPSNDPTKPVRTPRWLFDVSHLEQPLKFMADEIIMMTPYMSTHERTGLSPLKALRAILQAELDTRRKMHYAQKYGTPPGAFIMPGAAPGSPQKMRLMYDLKGAGRPTIMFMNLPKDSKFVNFSDVNLITHGTFQFYEILVRATAAAFGTTPFVLGWTDQDNRANSQTQLAITDRGEVALLKFHRQIINRYVIGAYQQAYGRRADNIWFNYLALKEEDEIDDAQSLRLKAGTNINWASINDIRASGGLPEFSQEEVGDVFWPFFSEPWVPSRLRGCFLPVTYAAMTWGISPDMTEEEIIDSLMSATESNPLPLPGQTQQEDGSLVGQQEPTDDQADAGRVAAQARRVLVNGPDPVAQKRLRRAAAYLLDTAA